MVFLEFLIKLPCSLIKLWTVISYSKFDVVLICPHIYRGLIFVASHSCKIIWNTDKSLKILRHHNHDVVELFSKLGIRFHIPTRLRSIDVDAVKFLAIVVSSFSSNFYVLFVILLLFLIFYSFLKLLDIFTLFLIDGYKPFFLQELSHLLQRFLLVFPTAVKHTK